MKRKLVMITVLAVILMVSAASAATQTIILGNTNTPELNGIKVQVTYDESGSISYQYIAGSAPVTNSPLGIDTVYYNLNDNVDSVSEPGWNTNFDGPTADGFGDFESHKNLNSGGTGGISSPIVFTLVSSFTLPLATNSFGATTAVHVRFSDGCSGWVSDGTTTQSSSNTACSSSTSIPEFPNIALPVGAAIGMLYIFQHMKRKEK